MLQCVFYPFCFVLCIFYLGSDSVIRYVWPVLPATFFLKIILVRWLIKVYISIVSSHCIFCKWRRDGKVHVLTEIVFLEALAKKHLFCSEGMVAGTGCRTLACALAKSWYTECSVQICLAANSFIYIPLLPITYFLRSYYQPP